MTTGRALTFGDLLRRYRTAAGLTQDELAERAGLSAKGIGDLERGARMHPRRDTVALLADALALGERERATFVAAARQRTSAVEAAASSPLSGANSEVAPLVGREAERAWLARHLDGEGPPLLLLAGEPGIGKTRLLRAGAEQAPSAGWTVLVGGCHRRSGQEPYAPFPDLLEQHLARQPAAERRLHLRECALLVRLLPELAEMLPAPAYTQGLPPEQERRLMFAAVARYLRNVAGPAGTLLVLDDLQWAGPDALDLLGFLLRPSPSAPALRVLGAYRDTEIRTGDPLNVLATDLAREQRADRIILAPLNAGAAATLLDTLLARAPVAETVATSGPAPPRELILRRTGGVPYFLVSYVQGIQSGALTGESRTVADVPWSAAETIRQRVVALPEAAQTLLMAAAVTGRVVSSTLLLSLSARAGQPERAVFASLDSACQARLLVEDGRASYAFAHDLIREVIVAGLSTAQRALLHRQVAEALEQQAGDPPVERLAYHYSQAGIPERAVNYLRRAGDKARAMFANADAANLYRQLVEYLDELDLTREATQAREQLGIVLHTMARYDEALDVLEQAIAAYRAANDLSAVALLTAQIGSSHANRGTSAEGIARVQALLALDGHRLPEGAQSSLYAMLVEIYWVGARDAEMLPIAHKALALAEATEFTHLRAVATGRVGLAQVLRGHIREGQHTLERALPAIEAIGDLWQQGRISENIAVAQEAQGDLAAALRSVERSVALGDQLGDEAARVYISYRHGMLAFHLGQWERARATFEKGMALGDSIHAEAVSGFPLLGLGQLWLATGDAASGQRALAEAVERARSGLQPRLLRPAQQALAEHDILAGNSAVACARLDPLLAHEERDQTLETTPLLALSAWAALELGDTTTASRLSAHAVERARGQHHRLALLDALRVQALIHAGQSHWSPALAALDEALALARDMPHPYAEAKVLSAYGEVLLARDEPHAARQHFDAARAILGRLGERLYAARVERALTSLPT